MAKNHATPEQRVIGMKKMINAWEKAAKDLGIEIEVPFHFNGEEFPLLIKYFGSRKGTVILDIDDIAIADDQISKDYYWSGLNPANYTQYNREKFIDTLEDWGWYGENSNKPCWYTGKYNQIKE
jgi:hypothetical protein